jgi:hypothetical protein
MLAHPVGEQPALPRLILLETGQRREAPRRFGAPLALQYSHQAIQDLWLSRLQIKGAQIAVARGIQAAHLLQDLPEMLIRGRSLRVECCCPLHPETGA